MCQWQDGIDLFLMQHPATRLLFIFAALLGLVAAFSAIDRQRRDSLEIVSFPTSLGDPHFFPNEADFALNAEVLRSGGQPLFRAANKISEKRDWLMRPTKMDDSGRWMIYREVLPKNSSRMLEPDRRFLKVGVNRYLRLTKNAPNAS